MNDVLCFSHFSWFIASLSRWLSRCCLHIFILFSLSRLALFATFFVEIFVSRAHTRESESKSQKNISMLLYVVLFSHDERSRENLRARLHSTAYSGDKKTIIALCSIFHDKKEETHWRSPISPPSTCPLSDIIYLFSALSRHKLKLMLLTSSLPLNYVAGPVPKRNVLSWQQQAQTSRCCIFSCLQQHVSCTEWKWEKFSGFFRNFFMIERKMSETSEST